MNRLSLETLQQIASRAQAFAYVLVFLNSKQCDSVVPPAFVREIELALLDLLTELNKLTNQEG